MFDDLIASLEARYGLMPGELRATMSVESSGSTDPDLLGRTPTPHGRAKGPFQIMEKFWGPLPPTFEGQAELAAQILSKGGKTPEERAASYYGRGRAPPGHPTTDEYVNKKMAAMNRGQQIPGAGPLLASVGTAADYPPGTPPERRSIGAPPMNEAAGLLEALTGPQGGPQGMDSLIAALTGGGEQKPKGFWDTLNANPLWHTGLATAAAPGFGGNAWKAVSTGLLAGQQNYEKMRQLTDERQQQGAKLKLDALSTMSKLKQQAYQQAYMQQLAKQYPEYAAAINAGFGEKVVENLLGVKPPEVRNFDVGGETVSKQWNPKTGTWDEVSRAPRWNPAGQGDVVTGYDAEGRPIGIIHGGGNNYPGMQKQTAKEQEQRALTNQNLQASLMQNHALYKKKFLNTGERLGSLWVNLKDRTVGLNEQEKKQYEPFWQWRSQTYNFLNDYIKETSGAAVTDQEKKRLLEAKPNPGEENNPFSGDSPSQYETKLNTALEIGRRAMLRGEFLRKYGAGWRTAVNKGAMLDDPLVGQFVEDQVQQLVTTMGIDPAEAEKMLLHDVKAVVQGGQ